MRHPDVATIKIGLIVEVLPSQNLRLIRSQFFVIILGNARKMHLCSEDTPFVLIGSLLNFSLIKLVKISYY